MTSRNICGPLAPSSAASSAYTRGSPFKPATRKLTREDAAEAAENLVRYGDRKRTLAAATIAAMAKRERQLTLMFNERHRYLQLMGATVCGDNAL